MKEIIIISIIVAFLIIVPALPSALQEKSWKRFLISSFLLVTVIILPIFVFVTSIFLVPQYKGGCHYGWFDCFHIGKLVLTPLVLWASFAFFAVHILRIPNQQRTWIVLGYFMGAVVSGICFIMGLALHISQVGWLIWWLIVPFYVAVLYFVLYIRAFKKSGTNLRACIIALASSIPLWGISLFWSKKYFLSLPDNPPKCFVVTSALYGHELLVGPFSKIERDGVTRIANRQLMTFWEFETIWRDRYPGTHQIFRYIYNRLGPIVACRMKTQLSADIVYLLIKPFEAVAAIIVFINKK